MQFRQFRDSFFLFFLVLGQPIKHKMHVPRLLSSDAERARRTNNLFDEARAPLQWHGAVAQYLGHHVIDWVLPTAAAPAAQLAYVLAALYCTVINCGAGQIADRDN